MFLTHLEVKGTPTSEKFEKLELLTKSVKKK